MKTLSIKLISPQMSLRPMDSEFKRRMSPSLALITLATLTPEPHKVYIEDENIDKINYNDTPDLVGITVNVDTTEKAISIAQKYRLKGCLVVFGGIHASASPFSMLNYCDSVCIGEAEVLWPQIINDAINGKLNQIYRNKTEVSLNKFPTPKWDYVNSNKYLYTNIVITSRGCPYKCDFCYNSCSYVDNKFKNRPIEHVIADIKQLKSRQIYFIDDNLIGNPVWFKKFLVELKKLSIIWHGAVSSNLVHHDDLITLMDESGCKSLFIGFESLNDKTLNSVNKKQNKVRDYERLIGKLHDYGIMVNASLVFGFDEDTKDTFQHTLDWLVKNKVETMTGHILTPYPGTKWYSKLEKDARISDYKLRHYNTSNVVYKPRKMSADELKAGYLWMYKKFYSYKNIIRRIPDNKSIRAPYLMFTFGYRKFGKLLSILGIMGLMKRLGNLGSRLSYGLG